MVALRSLALMLGELLTGFAAGNSEAKHRRELAEFPHSPRVRVAALDTPTASWYARVLAALKRPGPPIPANDLWIAASALENALPLLTYDRRFESVDGLALVTRPEDLLP